MRKRWLGFLTLLLCLVVLTPAALAMDLQQGNRLVVGADQTVDDDIVFTGTSVTIDGTVKGDVFAFAESVTVNGTVDGNLFAMGRVIDLNGHVTGLTTAGGSDLLLGGRVDGNLITFSDRMTIAKSAEVGRNWMGFGEKLRNQGLVERGIMAFAESLQVDGRVGQEVRAWTDDLYVGEQGRIDGPIELHSNRDPRIAQGAVTGPLSRFENDYNWPRDKSVGFLVGRVGISFTGFLVVGLLLLVLFPQLRGGFHQAVLSKPWQAPLAGLVILLVVPVAAILLLVTVVGIPLGVLSILLYPLALYFGQVLLAWTAGRLVADRWEWLSSQHWAIIFLAGALVTTLLTWVPGVGFIAVAYGLGGLYYAFQQSKRQQIAS